jgi:hypothetical protein
VKSAVYCHFPDDRIVRLRANGTFDVVATLPHAVAADGAMALDTAGLFARDAIVAATGGSASNGGNFYLVRGNGRVSHVRSYPGPGGADNLAIATELTGDFWIIRSTPAGYHATPLPTSLERTPWNLESAVYVR